MIQIKNNPINVKDIFHSMNDKNKPLNYKVKIIDVNTTIRNYFKKSSKVRSYYLNVNIDKNTNKSMYSNIYILLVVKMIKEVAEKFKDEVLKLKEYGFTPEIRGLLLNVRNFIDNVLEEDSKHPLELEVDSMLDRAKQGLPPKIRYISKKDGGRWKNPHEFLEEVYGQYLTHFTPSLVKDYIYLHQLKLIDENFYKRLTTYLHASNLSGIVPSISDYSLAKTKEDIPEYKIKIYNEVNRIYTKSSKNSKKKKKETC